MTSADQAHDTPPADRKHDTPPADPAHSSTPPADREHDMSPASPASRPRRGRRHPRPGLRAPTAGASFPASRLRLRDLGAVGSLGLRSRRGRTLLTALGIAVGIAAMVSVVGISASSRADLLAELDRLGTNLLQVSAAQSAFGEDTELPVTAPSMIRRIAPVESAAATRTVAASVRRTDLIDDDITGGIAVVATEPELLGTLGAAMADGRFLDDALASVPAVVLGGEAATRLGIDDVDGHPLVWLGEQWFAVVGILEPVPLAADIDRSALIGYPVAQARFGIDAAPSTVRVRTDPDRVEEVRAVLAPTTKPQGPAEVSVTRPSDALAAKTQVDESLTALLLSLGAVALLVGGIGIANVLVISVLERRTRSASAGRWAPPAATSACSSSSRPSCWPSPAAPAACCSARPSPPPTRRGGAGRWRSPPAPWPAASASPSPSAPSPASTPPPAPPASPPPTPSAPHDQIAGAAPR